jgi:2'-5' RNA ligase
MPEQTSFFEEPPQLTDTLFFALLPDAVAKQSATQLTKQLRHDHGLSGSAVATDKLHVTLHFLGDYPGLPLELIETINSVVALIKAPQFTVRFDYASSFSGKPNRQPLVLRGGDGVAGCVGLYKTLMMAASAGKEKVKPAHAFTPHMTLFYGSRLTETAIEPIELSVTEFVLLRNEINARKPYEVLGRWALQSS